MFTIQEQAKETSQELPWVLKSSKKSCFQVYSKICSFHFWVLRQSTIETVSHAAVLQKKLRNGRYRTLTMLTTWTLDIPDNTKDDIQAGIYRLISSISLLRWSEDRWQKQKSKLPSTNSLALTICKRVKGWPCDTISSHEVRERGMNSSSSCSD
jgi:hypothetical protein